MSAAGRLFDERAAQACRRLELAFEAPSLAPFAPLAEARPSLGGEIEIPWSGYFPQLWDRFGLDRGFAALSLEERLALSEACSREEEALRPRLLKTVECGVPRGNDRYWEFAFDPVVDWRWLDRKIELLEGSGLLPNNGARSFQITIAGLRQGPDAQALARLLEAIASSPRRLQMGLDAAARSVIHTGWARKGSGGVHEKGPEELKGGAPFACEFRTLSLPADPEARRRLLATASLGALAIEHAARTEAPTDLARAWMAWREECETTLAQAGAAPDRLAWASSREIDRVAWGSYMAGFESIAQRLSARWEDLSAGLDGVSWKKGEPVGASRRFGVK